MSVLQFFVPRVELHLFYNSIVFVPMVIGMYYHMFPAEKQSELGRVHLRLAQGTGETPGGVIREFRFFSRVRGVTEAGRRVRAEFTLRHWRAR